MKKDAARFGAAWLVVWLAVFGCSSSVPALQTPLPTATAHPTVGGGAAENVDACTLLTDAEIEQATGNSVASRAHSNLATVLPSVCDIELDGASITVGVKSTGGRSYYETYFEPFIGDEFGLLSEPVSGLADKAARDGFGYVMAVKGDALVDVNYIEFLREDKAAVAEELMRLALAKLP